VLHAVPAAAVPARIAPDGHESDAQLCAGVAVSARRLRAASFAMAREPGGSAVLSGRAWRRTAHAAAITCDLAAQMLTGLARMPEGISGVPPGQMTGAAASFTTARGAWRDAAWMWRNTTTDTSSDVSWTTADATDIVLRLGRLASGNPGWTPAASQKAGARPAENLARDARALADVLGAVHEAAEAITRMAAADFTAVDAVRRAGRLYMPARILGGDAMTSRYAHVSLPGDRAHVLKNACYLCFDTSLQAAAALDRLALRTQASSRLLGLFRSVLPGGAGAPVPETGFELSAGLFADQAGLFTRPPGASGRSVKRDHAYIISACANEHLTVEEIAERFSVSPYSVASVLTAAGREIRARPAAAGRDGSKSLHPVSPPPGPGPEEDSPLYHRLRNRGIDDPGLLERAAIIDRATADVMLSASEKSVRRNTAARLAAMDGPADARQAVSRAASAGPGQGAAQPKRSPQGTRATRSRRD
jgi:hypothetical protein